MPLDFLIAARVGLTEPSGVVLLNRVETVTKEFDKTTGRWRTDVRYEVPAIERLPAGPSQAAIADAIADLHELARENGAERTSVVVDISACGAPLLRALRDRKLRAAAVMVGDAAGARAADRHWAVPMRELLAITLGLLAESRIEVAELEHAATLATQLEAFRTKAPPKDALSDWRPAPHVDLAQALMLGAWWSERMLRSIVKQPPAPRVPVEPPRQPTFNELVKLAKRKR